MSNPFSNPDALTKDIAGILQKMQAAETNPLPTELIQAADAVRERVASARTSEEAADILKSAVASASKQTGAVYTNQDMINFERQVRRG